MTFFFNLPGWAAPLQQLFSHESNASRWIDLVYKGGWVMLPLISLSCATVYLVIERWLVLHKQGIKMPLWLGAAAMHWRRRDILALEGLLQENQGALARLLCKAVQATRESPQQLPAQLQVLGKQHIVQLEKNLPLLATIAGAAPMLGFLGTVTGMIRAFFVLAQASHALTPQLLSTGIYEAMVTTAAGLGIGIMAYLAYNYLTVRVTHASNTLTYVLDQLLLETHEPE